MKIRQLTSRLIDKDLQLQLEGLSSWIITHACIVSRVNGINPEYLEEYILGFQYPQNRLDVAGALLGEKLEYLDSENVNIVVAWALRDQQILRVLGSQGFLNSRKDQLIFMYPFKPGLDLYPLMNSPIDS